MSEDQKYFNLVAKIVASIADAHALALAENAAVYELGAAYASFDSNEFRELVRKWENKLQCPNKGCHCNACFQ